MASDDIQLPAPPEADGKLKYRLGCEFMEGYGYHSSTLTDFARAAVIADRASRAADSAAREVPEGVPPAFLHYAPKKPELHRVDFLPLASKVERGNGWITIGLRPAAPAAVPEPRPVTADEDRILRDAARRSGTVVAKGRLLDGEAAPHAAAVPATAVRDALLWTAAALQAACRTTRALNEAARINREGHSSRTIGDILDAADAALDQSSTNADVAHEIWAAAQLAPGEGITDAVSRVEAILASIEPQEIAAQPSAGAPAAPHALTDAEVHAWWARDNGLEDLDLCKLDDFRAAVRIFEKRAGAASPAREGEPDARDAEIAGLESACATLGRLVDELRPGAERYQYLRDRPLDTIDRGGVFAGRTPQNIVLNGEDLDAAIDEARGATPAAREGEQAGDACPECGGTGEMFGHADDCTDDLCALNGDMHSCAGKVEPCQCRAAVKKEG